jgi:hypothetical protein
MEGYVISSAEFLCSIASEIFTVKFEIQFYLLFSLIQGIYRCVVEGSVTSSAEFLGSIVSEIFTVKLEI